MLEGFRLVRNFTTAPFGDRHAGLFREMLGGNLVAEHSHRVRTRTQKKDPFAGQAFDKDGVFSNEPPAGPDRIGADLAQCGEHRVMI